MIFGSFLAKSQVKCKSEIKLFKILEQNGLCPRLEDREIGVSVTLYTTITFY